jgi:hypothetical protein
MPQLIDAIQNPEAAGIQHFPLVSVGEGQAAITTACAALTGPLVEAPTARSAADDWRVSLHEAGHVIVGRVLGSELGGVTIIPSETYGGLTWGPNHFKSGFDSAADDDDIVVPDLAEKISALMPGPGESRSGVVDIFTHVHIRVVELCAGTASESLLLPDEAPWVAHSDIRKSRALARLICTSELAIDCYLSFGIAEAKALIEQHRAAVLAIAEALMVHRTLDAEQIDTIIASAPERARRADWARVMENAAGFADDIETSGVPLATRMEHPDHLHFRP